LIRGASDTTSAALNADQILNQPDPTLTATFPGTGIGNQLRQVAKLIKIKDTLGMHRQIFFCSLGGFDTTRTKPTPIQRSRITPAAREIC
jgi:uncharacterized protein (DUF1501 family)